MTKPFQFPELTRRKIFLAFVLLFFFFFLTSVTTGVSYALRYPDEVMT